ncbi:hypothetical protein J7E90_17040 [Streptomyces sp. ISL-111]|uniref:hypothetical protein n=1 Tax=Streptomyces sp. ISL-111 TaxID=2819175 RepID=UPI001BEC1FAC|nr:hypothetical protein [Streptomyces sp. ISL-111]MBT2379008.1 hypothetical protein [Streptomyces sp. ISL-111]
MNPSHIPQLLKQVSYADPRVLPDDENELAALAALWAAVLADVPPDFAMHAVGQHYASSPFPIKPSDIAERWRTVVRDRMGRHTGTFEPNQHPGLDPDDIEGYQQALRNERNAVRTGQRAPTPSRAIAPSLSTDDVRAMRQQGDLLRHIKDASRTAREENARRRTLVARYPDLDEQMHDLPGHARWSGSVGGNKRTAAIVAEAEERAANERTAAA